MSYCLILWRVTTGCVANDFKIISLPRTSGPKSLISLSKLQDSNTLGIFFW